MGYTECDTIGQLHHIFVEPEEANSLAYQQFWEALARRESQRGQYKRITRSSMPAAGW